jgi:SAM-dependent methyltransferase
VSSELPSLHMVPSRRLCMTVLAEDIRRYADDKGRIRILEAGCGRKWGLDLDGIDYHLTGVDIDAAMLHHRRDVTGDLDECVHGDLRTTPLAPESFDVVFSSFVLEHVPGAEDVLRRVVTALKPGGLLLLLIPDRDSVFGLLTRHSPHWLHVAYRKWIQGHRQAGTPGHGPFPTVYDAVVSRRGIRRFCGTHGLRIVREYGENSYISFFGRLGPLVDLVLRAVAAGSRDRLSSEHNNLIFVIEKGHDGATREGRF